MLTKVGKVAPATKEQLRLWCYQQIPNMPMDVSRYAVGRRRLWLFNESNLQDTKITPAYYNQRLYDFSQRVFPGCDIGLLTFAGEYNDTIKSTGLIKPHRDHTFAQPEARLVNLGVALFGYAGQQYQLNDGEIWQFNCKEIHSVDAITSPRRFSIVFWKLNSSKGYFPAN